MKAKRKQKIINELVDLMYELEDENDTVGDVAGPYCKASAALDVAIWVLTHGTLNSPVVQDILKLLTSDAVLL